MLFSGSDREVSAHRFHEIVGPPKRVPPKYSTTSGGALGVPGYPPSEGKWVESGTSEGNRCDSNRAEKTSHEGR